MLPEQIEPQRGDVEIVRASIVILGPERCWAPPSISFRKGNILISQPLHRLMYMAVHYYKRAKKSPRNLKHEVLNHEYNKILKRKD